MTPEPGILDQPQDPRRAQQGHDLYELKPRREDVETRFREKGGKVPEEGELEEMLLVPVSKREWHERYDQKFRKAETEEQDHIVFEWLYDQAGFDETRDYIKDAVDEMREQEVEAITSGDELEEFFVKRVRRKERAALLLEWLKENQPEEWDPIRPIREVPTEGKENIKRRHMAELQDEVYGQLVDQGVMEEQKGNPIQVYTTLHTPLDTMNGVDAVVEVITPEGDALDCTVDVTTNKPAKQQRGHKADVVVDDIDFYGSEAEPAEESDAKSREDLNFKRVAKEIANTLDRKKRNKRAY